jgi:hypothetical protein
MSDNNNPIKYSDLIKPDSSITDLINQLDQLGDAYMNTLKNIKGEAITLKASLTSVSGATAEHRERIKGATEEATKLARAERDLAFAESENAKQLALIKKAQSEANRMNKLTTQLNNSAVGSYNQLSAQYSINKIYLNDMTVEEREATDAGRKLVEETNAIYEEMKRLQEVTGKHTLNVGNYEAATLSLRGTIRKNTEALAQMKLAGQDNTAEFQKLLTETGRLKDEMNDAAQSIKGVASDTSTFDSVLSGATAAGGGFSAFTGAMELFGAESQQVEQAQKRLQAAIAITTGLQAVQNNLQKESALMLGISKIQTYALGKAEAYRRLIQIQGTSATIGATVAQKAFNAVAAVNPYVLLAMALITVVGALVLFSKGSETAAEKQNRLNEMQRAYLESLEIEGNRITSVASERTKSLENELSLAKARNASTKEIQRIEDELAAQKNKTHSQLMGFYGAEMDQLDQNKEKLYQYRQELTRLQNEKANGSKKVLIDLELNGNVSKQKIDDAINAVQGKIDNLGKSVDIAVNLKNDDTELKAAEAERQAQRLEAEKEVAKTELELVRKSQDARIKLIQDNGERERATIRATYARQIQDLQYQLDNDKNLTAKGRAAINDTIVASRKQLAIELKDLDNRLAIDQRDILRKTQDIEIATMKDGADKKRIQTETDFARQIEDIQTRLDTERGLTVTQKEALQKQIVALAQQQKAELDKLDAETNIASLNKQHELTEMRLQAVKEGSQEEINLKIKSLQEQRAIELLTNRQLTDDMKQSEKDINAKYDALILKETANLTQQRQLMLFDAQQALEQSEFDLLRNSEERKTRFRLEAEKKRLQKILELNKTAGVKLSQTEVDTINNTIAKIDQEINKSKGKEKGDIYGMFGLNLDDDQKAAIDQSVSFAIGQVTEFLQAKVDAANIAVEAANKEVDSNEKRLQSELDARANGYASSVTQAQKELALAKKTQADALKEQEKAQKAQAAIQSIQQTGNLVTASALIWAQLGFPWAIPALAVMWGSFALAKIKASEVTKQADAVTYGDGGFEILNGGSHASGNDISIGTTTDGRPRTAEGGEALAIINKQKTRKYKSMLPGIIDSLNKGVFEEKYTNAYSTEGVQNNVFTTIDLTRIESSVEDIRSQGRKKTYTDGAGNQVEVYKNLKRTILSNN